MSIYLSICSPCPFPQAVARIVQNGAWYSGLSMNICRMNEQVNEETELDSVISQTHPWCWPAVLMGFPCQHPFNSDTSPPLPTVNRQNGLLLHRQNRSHLEATSLTNLQTASLHTRRRRWHPTPVLLPGKSHGRGNLAGYSPWGGKESDRT